MCFTCGFFVGRTRTGITIHTAASGEEAALQRIESLDELQLESNEPEAETARIVNINTALAGELQTLPGIGEVMAQRIIDYRQDNGKFESIEDICNVKGIGESKYNDIKDLICVQ